MIISRTWAMPSHDTFSVPPIGAFVQRHLRGVSCDPFARNSMLATYRNDLNPETAAEFHLDALECMSLMKSEGAVIDTLILDPPYSPRQISEMYKSVGRSVGMADTQASFWSKLKDAGAQLVPIGGVALTFGWNSQGVGKNRGFDITEILLVAHGGAHNDTICVAERRVR